MLAPIIALFDSHYRRLDAIGAIGFNRDLAMEVRERLEQMNYLIDRIRALEEVARKAQERSESAFRAHTQDIMNRGV